MTAAQLDQFTSKLSAVERAVSDAACPAIPDGYVSFADAAHILFGDKRRASDIARFVMADMALPESEQKFPRVSVDGITYIKIPDGTSATQILEQTSPERVYFIRGGEFVKVGVTLDVDKRLAAIQTSCPYRCEIVHVEAGGYPREKELHRRFKEYRARGEWFRYEGRLAAYIEAGAAHPIPTKGRSKK